MPRFAGRRLGVGLIVLGVVAGAVAAAVAGTGVVRRVELATIDARFDVRGERPASPRVVLVALDEASLRRLRPPLPRRLYARVTDELRSAGAAVIAIDIAFPARTGRHDDQALVAALARAPRAVVSVSNPPAIPPLAGRTPFEATRVLPGHTSLWRDRDGSIRAFPHPVAGVAAFGSAAATLAHSPSVHQVPPPPRGALIDYPGPPGAFRSVPLANVLRGRFERRAVRGKVVVVGYTATALGDRHETPVAAAMPGPELQAAVVATALDGYPLRLASGRATWLALPALGGFVALLMLALSAAGRGATTPAASPRRAPGLRAVLLAGVLVAAGWSLAAQVAFDRGTVVPYTAGMLAVALATAAGAAMAVGASQRELRELRRRFAERAPEIVEQVLSDASALRGRITSGDVVAGYRLLRQIGVGGMGAVYLAVQERLDRLVALKLIRPELADDPEYRAAFEQESRLAAAVSHHHVVPILDAGDDRGLLYLVMQYVEGETLAAHLDAYGVMTPFLAACVARGIGGALDAVHGAGLVHRDVTPANVLLAKADLSHAYLTDFGLARYVGHVRQLEAADGWLGTTDYEAPEQVAGEPTDRRADVYALTTILFRCLTGRLPFPDADPQARRQARLKSAPVPALTLRPELPRAIEPVLACGLARDPTDRFATAGQLAVAACEALGLARAGALPAQGEPPIRARAVADGETPRRGRP